MTSCKKDSIVNNTNIPIVNNTNIPELMPGNADATSPTTGNIFTDVFTSIKLKYVYIGNVPGHPAEKYILPKMQKTHITYC
jgi:hypothetical protein